MKTLDRLFKWLSVKHNPNLWRRNILSYQSIHIYGDSLESILNCYTLRLIIYWSTDKSHWFGVILSWHKEAIQHLTGNPKVIPRSIIHNPLYFNTTYFNTYIKLSASSSPKSQLKGVNEIIQLAYSYHLYMTQLSIY